MQNILRTSLLVLTITAMLFGQSRNISEVGPKTEDINKSDYGVVYYVAHYIGSDKDGKGSKENPWKTLTHALNVVQERSENNKVALFVGAGIYSGITLKMKEYVDIYGGFNCKTWERDIYKYSSVLDGENARRVVEGADNARLDGFTVTNGLSRTHGGGIMCDDTSPTISNCYITNNYILEPENFNHTRIHQEAHHGAGIACFFNSVPVIRNNVFSGNRTSIGTGAGVAFYGWLRMKDDPKSVTHIKDNFMVDGYRPVLKDNVFVNNVTGINDIHRTRSSSGGAISCAFESRPIIENNVIAMNQAKGRSDAGGVYSEYFSYPTINSNWIVGNISDDDGGGIYTMKLGQAIISNNYIAGNWTLGNGAGGIRISKEGRATIENNIIVRNQTGGGVQAIDGHMELINNIIMNNQGNVSVKYSNNYTYFISSIVEGNVIRENEGKMVIETMGGEDLIIKNNNTDENLNGNGNINKKININDTDLKYEIVKMNYDIKNCQTIIELKETMGNNVKAGRVVCIDKRWSVINKVEGSKVYLWGDITSGSRKSINWK